MNAPGEIIKVPTQYKSAKVVKVKVKKRQAITPSTIVCALMSPGHPEININGPGYGKVTMLCQEGSILGPNDPLFKYEGCGHHVVMRDLCAECGANLRKEGGVCGERITAASASIPMVHMIPDLHVSESVAAEIALKDEESLLAARKLALLIDLDQTVLHTTTTPHAFRYKNVHRFNLAGCEMMYHTRFRPHLEKFLRRMVKRFQMHICTFGNRAYAHQLASILDPKRKYFCQRILSRDECFNPVTKSANLKALFPRGVHLVCIIDDRGDVWDWSPNLIQVQPYRFFPEVGDINGPPGRPLSMMPMPDFRAFNPPSPTGTSTSTDTSNSSDEEGSSSFNLLKPDVSEASNPIVGSADSPSNTVRPLKLMEEVISPKSSAEPSASLDGDAQLKIQSKLSTESQDSTNEGANTEHSKESPQLAEEKTKVKPPLLADEAPEPKIEAMEYPPLCESPPPPQLPPLSLSSSIFEMSEEALDDFDADYLIRLEEVLMEIHRRYYRAYDKHMAEVNLRRKKNTPMEHGSRLTGIPHVANVMAQMRARVLGPHVHVTLSGLTPRNQPACDSLAGQIALGLGATLHNRLRLPKQPLALNEKLDNRRSFTTHLVACRQNTEKVIAARSFQTQCTSVTCASLPSPLVHIVSPGWLWVSHFRWQRLPELQFPLNHDYSVHVFDPEANSPASLYGKWRHHRQYRRHQHRDRLQVHTHHQRRHPFVKDEPNAVMQISDVKEKQDLSSSMVRSAMESIEKELRGGREHNRSDEQMKTGRKFKRTVSESAGASCTPVAKRLCLRKSDGHLAIAGEIYPPDKSPTSPSLSSTEDDLGADSRDDKAEDNIEKGKEEEEKKTISTIAFETVPINPSGFEESLDNMAVISDTDEEGLDSTLAEDDHEDDDDEDDCDDDDADDDDIDIDMGEEEEDEVVGTKEDDGEGGGGGEESENDNLDSQLKLPATETTEVDLQEEMKHYLPPPCPLEFAENPLLHMSPQAASQMLDEVEEAVMEEREERSASVPREMENETSSSSSSSSTPSIQKRRIRRGHVEEDDGNDEDSDENDNEDDSQGDDRVVVQRDLEQEERWLRIRQQLLLRRGGANRRALAKVEKRLREISRGDSVGRRSLVERDRERQDSYHHRFCGRSLRLSDELTEQREFNTCPEGYDYTDAEQARELLRPEKARQEARSDRHRLGDDEDACHGVKARRKRKVKAKKAKRVIGAAGYLEVSLFGSDVSSSSSPSCTDSDDCKGGGDNDDGTIRSDALKEFM